MGEATDRGGAASAPHGGWVEEGRGRARGLSRTDGGGGDRDESDGGDVAAGITRGRAGGKGCALLVLHEKEGEVVEGGVGGGGGGGREGGMERERLHTRPFAVQ